MKVTVVGYQDSNFTDRQTGEYINGRSVKCIFDSPKDTLVGQDIMKLWLKAEFMQKVGFKPEVGDLLDLDYEYDGTRMYLVGYQKR